MPIQNLFPEGVCVIACSGPSLNKVDCFSLGVPVVAVSTAIRSLKKANYWVLADNLNVMHGEEGKIAWEDEDVVKVIQSTKSTRMKYRSRKGFNLAYCEDSNKANINVETRLFVPEQYLLRGPHKSVTMAIQWAHIHGAKNLIFTGNDLHADTMENKYAYPAQDFDLKKKHNFKKTLDQVKTCLQGWYPIAKRKGFEWYSWECGEIFSSMVPRFQPDMLEEIKKKSQ